MIKLGQKVRDKITGFEGIAIARTEWLYSCVRLGVQGQKVKDDGTLPEAQWFDEPQLEPIEEVERPKPRTNGGPALKSRRRPDPTR